MWNEGIVIPGIGDMFLRGGSRISEVGESGNLRFRGSGATTSTDQMVVTGRGCTAPLRLRVKRCWVRGMRNSLMTGTPLKRGLTGILYVPKDARVPSES